MKRIGKVLSVAKIEMPKAAVTRKENGLRVIYTLPDSSFIIL